MKEILSTEIKKRRRSDDEALESGGDQNENFNIDDFVNMEISDKELDKLVNDHSSKNLSTYFSSTEIFVLCSELLIPPQTTEQQKKI